MYDEKSVQEMTSALGMATFQAQALEYSLVTLHAVTVQKNEKPEKNIIQKLMDTRYKQTLGRLIKDAFETLYIPISLQEELKNALEKRNWVTHHFFRKYGAIGFNVELQKKATQELIDIWLFLETVCDDIHALTMQRLKDTGKSEVEINKGIEQAVNEYLNELENT